MRQESIQRITIAFYFSSSRLQPSCSVLTFVRRQGYKIQFGLDRHDPLHANDSIMRNTSLVKALLTMSALFCYAITAAAANVRVGVADISQSQISLFVARDKGYYRQE